MTNPTHRHNWINQTNKFRGGSYLVLCHNCACGAIREIEKTQTMIILADGYRPMGNEGRWPTAAQTKAREAAIAKHNASL